MRGAERPGSVRWTRPFLQALRHLEQDTARQTFMDVTDKALDLKEIDQVLLLADNMPLAIDLIAHLVDSEGISSVLARWETDRTSILSEGWDSGSNLDLSISLSISGSRMRNSPDAFDLLTLLALLPDGLSDTELLQSKLPLDNILACKSTLLSTALAYKDGQNRLKMLVPIREYVQKAHPASNHLIRPLSQHFQQLLDVWYTYLGKVSSAHIVHRINSNYANVQSLFLHGMNTNNPQLAGIISSTCTFDSFSGTTGHGVISWFDKIPDLLADLRNPGLEMQVTTQVLYRSMHKPVANAPQLIEQAMQQLGHIDDPLVKCESTLSSSLFGVELNIP
jgi:hypothetical protein